MVDLPGGVDVVPGPYHHVFRWVHECHRWLVGVGARNPERQRVVIHQAAEHDGHGAVQKKEKLGLAIVVSEDACPGSKAR